VKSNPAKAEPQKSAGEPPALRQNLPEFMGEGEQDANHLGNRK
jgi:hypothetical protein